MLISIDLNSSILSYLLIADPSSGLNLVVGLSFLISSYISLISFDFIFRVLFLAIFSDLLVLVLLSFAMGILDDVLLFGSLSTN